MRQAICFAIRSGTFDYAMQFPQSTTIVDNKGATKYLTIEELFTRYLSLKTPEISLNTLRRYHVKIETCSLIIGKHRLVKTLKQEDLLRLRNELLTCLQHPQRNRKTVIKGLSIATVNDYVTCCKGAIKFSYDNGYIDSDQGSLSVN